MKAGSRVTTPVFARRFWMSMPFSLSVPVKTGNSRSLPSTVMRALSPTAVLPVLKRDPLSPAAEKESRPATEVSRRFERRATKKAAGRRAGRPGIAAPQTPRPLVGRETKLDARRGGIAMEPTRREVLVLIVGGVVRAA